MGHFALTDVDAGRHHAFERYARATSAPDLALAGAQATPFKVWLEDWSLSGGADNLFPLRLRAAEDGIAIDLTLDPGKPLVLQGDRGLSRKSGEPGNASYYYSATRLATRGSVTTDQGHYTVTGLSWLDREWSSSALGARPYTTIRIASKASEMT
jgi:predicted secreted hydrolase